LEAFELGAIPPEPLAAFLAEHGFTSLLKRLDAGRGSPERATQLHPAKTVTASAAPATGAARQEVVPCPPSTCPPMNAFRIEALDRWIARVCRPRGGV
jgi:DNA polymerase-1